MESKVMSGNPQPASEDTLTLHSIEEAIAAVAAGTRIDQAPPAPAEKLTERA